MKAKSDCKDHCMKPGLITLISTLILVPLTPYTVFSQIRSTASAYAGIDEPTLIRLREVFAQAADSLDATLEAINFLESRFPGDFSSMPAIVRAYRASLTGLLGKHTWNLFDKLNRVTASIKAWEGLVEQHPTSLEVRFQRYAYFSQLPAFFKVGPYVKPDLAALLGMLEGNADDQVPKAQRAGMIAWLLSEGKLSSEERARVKALR